jgi:hypothetical protein
MMPAHYALSDAVIVLVAIYAAVALLRERLLLPAFAIGCFGIPAAVGVVRFGAGLQEELALLHAGSSQLLGLAGATALAAACFQRIGSGRDLLLAAQSLIVAGAISLFASILIAPLFILALAVALCAALIREAHARSGWLRSVGIAWLLANALVIRRAPWLSEGTAWHAYHLLVALSLAILAMGMRRRER